MTRAEVLELIGVFLGGAVPMLEAVVVIPIGILAGLPVVPVVLAAVTGNLLTVALAAWFGEQIRARWRGWRGRGDDVATDPSPRRQRIERIVARWGLPGLALVGPIGLGTQLSVVVAIALGTPARRAFAWIAAGTVGWALVAAVVVSLGLDVAGFGGG